MGQKAISSMLDEGLVEATQTLRVLEEGDEEDFYPIEPSVPSPEPERPTKKARSDKMITNGSQEPSGGKLGMFSADAIDNIKFYAEMARKQAEEAKEKQKPQTGMALLGGYGSDDDSD